MTDGQPVSTPVSSPELFPPWQVYVYFKVSTEYKAIAIDQSLQILGKLKGVDVALRLMERADEGGTLNSENIHTLMEVYTPNPCNTGLSCSTFSQLLQEATLNWCANLAERPLRMTEVFINTQVP